MADFINVTPLQKTSRQRRRKPSPYWTLPVERVRRGNALCPAAYFSQSLARQTQGVDELRFCAHTPFNVAFSAGRPAVKAFAMRKRRLDVSSLLHARDRKA